MPIDVVQGSDDDAGPELRAVLAYSPTFVLNVPLRAGGCKFCPRLAGRDVLGEIKMRKVLAQHLITRVPLDPLSTGIPAGNDAIWIEHVDRVVHHAFNQQAKSLFTLTQRLFGSATRGEIARDFGKPEKLPRLIAQRCDDDIRPEARAILAQAPSFILEASLERCHFELMLGPPSFPGFFDIENREVPPDDLAGFIAFELLRTQ